LDFLEAGAEAKCGVYWKSIAIKGERRDRFSAFWLRSSVEKEEAELRGWDVTEC
jgi:hypothetical protein